MFPQEVSLAFSSSNDIDLSFESYRDLYGNYVHPSLKERNEKDSSSEERLDYDPSDDDAVIDREGFSPSFNNNYSSLMDINGLGYKKDFCFCKTLSVYDISMQNTDFDNVPLDVYSNFNSYEVNGMKKDYNEIEEVPSLIPDLEEINIPAPYILNIFGIPEKSRVETQVKLGIKLTPSSSVEEHFNNDFFWLKLPSWSITKEKLKLPNLKNHPKYIDPEKILTLEPSVVCASDITKNVLICSGCIIRERKRAIRKKKTKFQKEFGQNQDSLSPIKDEEKKIILFNYPEIFRFKDNYINIPTRITCYCRHHKENIGFRILINIKDNKGQLIASTLSKPFMITDDHKTISKIKKINGLHLTPNSLPIPVNDNNSNQKKNILFNEELKLAVNPENFSCSTLDNMTNKNIIQPAYNSMIYLQDDISNKNKSFLVDDKFMGSESYESLLLPANVQQDELETIPQTSSLVLSQVSSPETVSKMPFSIDSNLFDLSLETQWSNKELHMNIDQTDFSNQVNLPVPNNYTPIELSENPIEIPIIDRLIPSEGPMHGGIEVTILGSGFYSGLTCIFGHNPVTSIHYWSPTVIVCTLPPSPIPGPVLVDFKEHNLAQSDIENAKYFLYKDDNDRTLMELALQVVGIKMTGKLENALTIAMKICGLMPSDCNESNLKQQQSNLNSYKPTLMNYLHSSSTFNIYKAYYCFETMFFQHDNLLNIKANPNTFYLLYQDRPNQTLLNHIYVQELQRHIIELFSKNYYLRSIKQCRYNHVDYLNMKKMNFIVKMLENTEENRFIYRSLYRKVFKLTYPNSYIEISNFLRLNREHMDYIIVSLVFSWLNQNNFILKKRSNALLRTATEGFDDNDFFDIFFSSKKNNRPFKNRLNKTKKYSEVENLHHSDSLVGSYNTDNESKEISSHFSQSQHIFDIQENQTTESNIKDEKNDDGIFTIQGFSEFLTMTSAKAKLASLSIPSILRTSSLPQFSEFGQFHPISAFNSFIQQYPFISKKANNSKSSSIMENDIQYNWWQHLIFGPPPPYSELSTNENVFETPSDASEDFVFSQEKSQRYSFKWQPKVLTRSRTAELILEQQQFIREHAKIIQKLEKDKMLYLFWLPILIILSSYIILNWTQKDVSIRIYDLRRAITFSI
ncbi:hypothetical protein PNEG_00970 [Pneumocystis murina B123]|uniref:IPT/TIG domain-containing protein n=1 Tax=Pneumocystis murina (strain B123) TaxID=1069680 RepID=M7PK57_PNEMU|nr:hypothetical protein PNEG_00970 [Pneumocystis murina B123]EMR10823.1 hypothetical protein PNEG_00970 [Pneumocystis murina B123]